MNDAINAFNAMMKNGIENHMLFGGCGGEEPEKTDVECDICGQILTEGEEYRVFTILSSEKEVIICGTCDGLINYKTAEMPIIERDED